VLQPSPLVAGLTSLELTALERRGSARKGKEEFALSGLGKRLLAAAHLGSYTPKATVELH
jgi:hypothetical protein